MQKEPIRIKEPNPALLVLLEDSLPRQVVVPVPCAHPGRTRPIMVRQLVNPVERVPTPVSLAPVVASAVPLVLSSALPELLPAPSARPVRMRRVQVILCVIRASLAITPVRVVVTFAHLVLVVPSV